ncbi:MAG TPA: hypothetical protein VE965_04915 [Gammaproteobacteria bacterium]|nr:hypothetical protein [Gammaproteobacteria bacterium]
MSPETGHSGDANELQSERLTDKILRALIGIRYGSTAVSPRDREDEQVLLSRAQLYF